MSTGPPVDTARLVAPPWQSSFLGILPWQCIFWKVLGFIETFRFRALSLGMFPLLVGNFLGYAVAQMRILSVPYIPWLSYSAWGGCAGFLQCLAPQTPHFYWSINASWSGLLSLALRQYWEVFVLVSPQGLPRSFFLPQACWLAILVGSTVG